MSASRERKKREELGKNTPAVQQPAQKKKISEGLIFAIVMLLIVACFVGFIVGRGIWARNQTVLTVGEHEVSVKEFNYFFNSIANQYLTYASYFGSSYGVTTETPLDQTELTSSHVNFLQMMSMYGYLSLDTSSLRLTADGTGYEGTVAELLADNAKSQVISCYVTYDEAQKNSYELEENCYAEIDTEIEELKAHGEDTYGWNLKKTIRNTFGSGCTKQGYYDYLVLTHTASHYMEALKYSDEEIEARYNENAQEFDIATFYHYTVSPSDFLEADEEGNMPEATDAEKEKAKVSAEDMEKNFTLDNEEKTVELRTDYTYDGVKNLCGEEAAKWIFDATTAADAIKLFSTESGTYHVLKFVNRDDYDLANVMQIFIPADAETTEEEPVEGEESEEAAEPAIPAADKLADIDNTLAADASAESFKALAEKYAEEGAEIEVEKLTRSSLANVSKDSCLWAMEAGRAVGDYAKFEVSGGTLYVMITGYGESFVQASVNQTMASEWLEEACKAAEEVCGYSAKAAMLGNVGLAMSQQDLGV